MKRGKVILTPFPFTDLSGNKVRPAVIVSSDARHGADVIIAFIASAFNPFTLQPTDLLLRRSDPHFAAAGLKRSSVFKMDKVATISRTIILGELGDIRRDTSLVCHSERNEESLVCKLEIPRFSRNDIPIL